MLYNKHYLVAGLMQSIFDIGAQILVAVTYLIFVKQKFSANEILCCRQYTLPKMLRVMNLQRNLFATSVFDM